ncbi:MAG: hypothetical protein AB1757_10320 [Acidobacteriota bacterium]
MKKSEISFDSIPGSARSEISLTICLKCAFDFFTKQLNLTPRTAYSELKKHLPEETDFTGASTARPHFFKTAETKKCPYCKAAKKWFADFRAIRIDAHPSFEKERKKLWTALKKASERFALWHPERTTMQIFSEWLERLNRRIDFANNQWLLDIGIETVKRYAPSNSWDEVLAEGVHRLQLSHQVDDEWHYERQWLYVSPRLYGNALMVQHLLSRSHYHGGRTFEGHLTLHEFVNRLRKTGYLAVQDITTHDAQEAFEQAIARLVETGPVAVYYAVDRNDYLARLKELYEKQFKN